MNSLTMYKDLKDNISKVEDISVQVGEIIEQPTLNYTDTLYRQWIERFEAFEINVKDFGAKGDGVADDTDSIKAAIAYATSKNVFRVSFPYGNYVVSSDIEIPSGMCLYGIGKKKSSTQLYYIGEGWCIKTSGGFGQHRRNTIDGINIYMKSLTAKGAILIGDETDDTVIPVQHILRNIEILDLSANQIGIWLKNTSGIDMLQVLANRGTGGTCLLISANGNNTGVMNFNCCSFGGHNQNDIGIELRHGTGGLDGFCFNGCYFGGKKPFLISGNSSVKNITLNATHVETTTVDEEYYAFDINSVVGLTINSITIYGKRDANFVGFIFRGTCRNITITGIDCNEFSGGTLYKYVGDSVANFSNSLLFEGSPTGSERNIVQTSGDFKNITILSAEGKIRTNSINTSRIDVEDVVVASRLRASSEIILGSSNSKIQYSSIEPDTCARGGFYFNQTPSELGVEGSKYVILGWIGVGTNDVRECRCLTGN